MKTSSYRWTHSYGTPPPFFWDPKMGFWWETLGNHETRDFGTFCLNRKAAASKLKLGLQMCGDLVWMRRESPGQGLQSRKGTSFISSRRSLHRSSWTTSGTLPASSMVFWECLEQIAMDFLEKWRRLFVYERLSPGKPRQPGKGSHPIPCPKMKVPQ